MHTLRGDVVTEHYKPCRRQGVQHTLRGMSRFMSEARRAERSSKPFVGQADSLSSFFFLFAALFLSSFFFAPALRAAYPPAGRPQEPFGPHGRWAGKAGRQAGIMPTWPFGPPALRTAPSGPEKNTPYAPSGQGFGIFS